MERVWQERDEAYLLEVARIRIMRACLKVNAFEHLWIALCELVARAGLPHDTARVSHATLALGFYRACFALTGLGKYV